MSLLHFLNSVRKHLWALMSCAAFTLLGMWILYANKNNGWALQATFGLAGVCLFWACYLAWKTEHDALIAEQGRHLKPNIHGEAKAIFWESTQSYFAIDGPDDSLYYVLLRLVNHADVPCTVDKFQMFLPGRDGVLSSTFSTQHIYGTIDHISSFGEQSPKDFPTRVMGIQISQMEAWGDHPLAKACAQEGWVMFRIGDHVPLVDQYIGLKEFPYFVVTDSLGNPHNISGAAITTFRGNLRV
jgi:hypothetical protein